MNKIFKKTWVCVVVLIMAAALTACFEAKEKTFTSSGFSVTLTDAFHEKEYISFNLYLESSDMIFTGLVEDGAGVVSNLTAYTNLVIEANSLSGMTIKTDTGNDESSFKYFVYEKTVSAKDFTYMAVTKAGQNSKYYMFNFACETKNFTDFESKFLAFAKTIVVE